MINQFAIVDAVNAKLPKDDQFNPIGWWLPKTLRLHHQYNRLYPDGPLVRRQGILAAVMLFCIVLVAGLIGFGYLAIAWLWRSRCVIALVRLFSEVNRT